MSDKNVDDLASLDPLNIVKNYVAEVMDRPLQRRLSDTHRNNTQRSCLQDNQDKPLMIFETDDTVFVYNPNGRSSSGKTYNHLLVLLNKTPSVCFRKRWIISKSSTPGDQ